mmetsp:Transcript_1427/g.3607  ORF Transcript_1427/g.3607 Transcript_1427/m.3607 type:complete len:308 (+) Transcript_1427:220-1143(+)
MPSTPYRRSWSSLSSSCLDSVEALFQSDVGMIDANEDGEEFIRDGGHEGAIFLGGNHLGDKGVARIVDGLHDPCREYYKLYLCDNRIGHLGASILSYSLKYNTALMELSLGSNHLSDEGATYLASSLSVNNTLEMLNLENNNIGPSGVTALAHTLEHENNSLHWLVLSENPIGDEGTMQILKCIGNSSSFDCMETCNHYLLSIVLKKVTKVKDTTLLRKIQCYLKINRLSVPSPRLAAQRKMLMQVNENPNALLDFFCTMQRDDAGMVIYLKTCILALLGGHGDLSTSFVVLKNSPHVFSSDPDMTY